MKLTKSSKILIITFIYTFMLYLGINAYTHNSILLNIRKIMCYLYPAIVTLKIIFDNRKNISCLFKNKLYISLYALSLLWLLFTAFNGIKFGYDVIKGIAHYGILFTFMLVIINLKLTKDEKSYLKKHFFFSFFLSIVLGIMQYVFKYNLNTFSNTKYIGIFGRINATFSMATLYDKIVCMLFPFISYELIKNDKYKKNYLILFITSMFGVTLTFSRTGQLIYLLLIFSFIIISIINKKYKYVILAIITTLIMVHIPGAKYSVQSALEYAYKDLHIPKTMQINLTKIIKTKGKVIYAKAGECVNDDCVDNIDGSEFFREYYKKIGKEFIKEYPLSGIGVNNYNYLFINQNAAKYLNNNKIISGEYPYMFPHCGFIQNAAEIGYIGLILISIYMVIFSVIKFINMKTINKFYLHAAFITTFILSNITENIYTAFQVIYLVMFIYQIYNIINYKENNN